MLFALSQFVGYPNTGKSSVINSLARRQSVGTSSTPGFTTHLTQVKLDAHIRMIDSPGVIVSSEVVARSGGSEGRQRAEARLVLRNALKIQSVDAELACRMVLACVDVAQLLAVYELTEESVRRMFEEMLPAEEGGEDALGLPAADRFLFALSRHLKHVKKGGVPDIARTARRVLKDWNSGKIGFYVVPPEEEPDLETGFVQEFAEALDIDSLMKDNQSKALAAAARSNHTRMKEKGRLVAVTEERFAIANEMTNGRDTEDALDDEMVASVSRSTQAEQLSQLDELSAVQSKPGFRRTQPDLTYLEERGADEDVDVEM